MMKKTGRTYEEFMNSRFLEVPSYNELLFILFKPLVICLFLAISALVSGIFLDLPGIIIGMTIAISFICVGRLQLAYLNMQGHGVGRIPKEKLSFLSLSKRVLFSLVFLLLIASIMVVTSFWGDFNFSSTKLKFEFLSIFLWTSIMLSILNWKFHAYYVYYHGDEYEARVYLMKKGYSTQEVDDQIAYLKKQGILSARK